MEWFMEASWRLRAPLCCQTRIPLLFQDGFIGSAKWFRAGLCGFSRVGFGRGWLRPADVIAGFELDRRGLRIERDANGIAAAADGLELLAQHPPDHQDAAVALAEMLFGMQRDRSLADLRLVVAGK